MSAPIDPIQPETSTTAVALDQESAPTAHGKLRTRRLWMALLFAALIKPLSLVISAVTPPLFLKYLGGSERYGLFELMGAVTYVVSLVNVGLPMALGNKLITSYADNDRELARRQLTMGTFGLSAVAILSAIVISTAAPFIDWRRLLHISGSLSTATISWTIWTATIVALLGFISSLPQTIYFSQQELHRSYIWEGVAKVATLAMCVAVVYTKFGIIGVVLAAYGTTVVVRLINLVMLLGREKPWLRPNLRAFDWSVLWNIWGQGVLFFLLGAANIALFQIDKLIIGMGKGLASVTDYAVIGRIFMVDFGVFSTLLAPLWTACGEAARRGDLPWVKRWLWRSLLLGCGSPLIAGIALYFWSGPILHIYLRGQTVYAPRSMIAAITLTFVCRAWVDCRSVILNSTGVLVPQLIFYVGHALLYLAVATSVVGKYGATGVAWAMPVTAAVTSVWGYPLLMRKYIFKSGTGASSVRTR